MRTPAPSSARDAIGATNPARGTRTARPVRFASNGAVSSTIARDSLLLGTGGQRVEGLVETLDHQRVEHSATLATDQTDGVLARDRCPIRSRRRERIVDIGYRYDPRAQRNGVALQAI